MAYMFGAAIRGIWSSVFANPANSNSDTATSSTNTDNMDFAKEIPWVDITEAHMSNLRGHVRYLDNIGTKLNVADKLENYNKRAAQALADAEAAALIAGIEISPKDRTTTRVKESHFTDSKRRRRSPNRAAAGTDLEDNEVSVPKKVKFRSPVASPAEKAPEFSRRAPPTPAEIAHLSSRLGKHERPQDPNFQGISEKGTKRNRNSYFDKKNRRRQQLEGEETDDDEGDAGFAPLPDYVKDRLPASRPAPKRRGTHPFTNELVVPVETNGPIPTDQKSKFTAPTVAAGEGGNCSSAPKTTTTTSLPKATIPTPSQASHPEVEKPAMAQAPNPEANRARKRTAAEPTARPPRKSTTTKNPAQTSQVEAKPNKHSAEGDSAECPPTVKKQKKYIQRLIEDSAKRNSTVQNGDGPFVVKKRKVA